MNYSYNDALQEKYNLHRFVYLNESDNLKTALQSNLFGTCNVHDVYGNTPLHLATMLGRQDCIDHLLFYGACVEAKNIFGWTPIDEAICRRNSAAACKMWHIMRVSNQQLAEDIFFKKFLSQLPDMDLQVDWQLQSWIPFVTHFLPNDKCRIRKKGTKMRLDMTLKNFEELSWVRGQISYILDGDLPFDEKLILLDHDDKVYASTTRQLTELDSRQFELEWDLIMNSPVAKARIHHDNLFLIPQTAGWILRNPTQKVERIGNFEAKLFTLSNIVIKSKSRHEHVTESLYTSTLANLLHPMRPLTENKLRANDDSSASSSSSSTSTGVLELPSWTEYASGRLDERACCLGCLPEIKNRSHTFSFSLSMAEGVYFPIHAFLQLLDLLNLQNDIELLKSDLVNNLPPGFPLRIETQIFPTITAKVVVNQIDYFGPPAICQHNLAWSECCSCHETISPGAFNGVLLDDALFQIPSDYSSS